MPAWTSRVLARPIASLTLFSTLSSCPKALRVVIRASAYCWLSSADWDTATAREAACGSSEGLTTRLPLAIC
ncbi:hypothetical protein D3C78_1612930 [compost metagenome]